jgi:hypothetical protein
MNVKQHVLGASKNGQTKKSKKKNIKERKQRNYTLLSSLLDFYYYIFAFDEDSYSGYSELERSNWIKISSCPYYYIFHIWIKIPIYPKSDRSN